jgi:hypothetical protein
MRNKQPFYPQGASVIVHLWVNARLDRRGPGNHAVVAGLPASIESGKAMTQEGGVPENRYPSCWESCAASSAALWRAVTRSIENFSIASSKRR